MRYIMLYPYVALVEGKDTGALYDLLNRKMIELEHGEFNLLKQAQRGTSIDELYGYNLSDIHQVLNKIKQFKLGFDYESKKPYFCDLLKTSDEAMKLSHFKKPPRLSRLYIELNNQCNCKCWFCGDNPLKRTLGCLGCNIWNTTIKKKLDTFTITELFTAAIEMNFQEIVLTGGNILEEWSIIQSISDFFSKITTYIVINLCSLDPLYNIQQLLSVTGLNYILNIPLITEEDSRFENILNYRLKQLYVLDKISNKKIYGFIIDTDGLNNLATVQEKIITLNLSQSYIEIVDKNGFKKMSPDLLKFLWKGKYNPPGYYEYYLKKQFNPCMIGSVTISCDGSVYACRVMRKNDYGNIYITPLDVILTSSGISEYWQLNKDSLEPCKTCHLRYSCDDCRALESSLTGDPVGVYICGRETL